MIAGSTDVWSAGFGGLIDTDEGTAVWTVGCEIDVNGARTGEDVMSPVLNGERDKLGDAIMGS